MNSNRKGFIASTILLAFGVFAQEFTPPPTIVTPPVVTEVKELVPVSVVTTQMVERTVATTNTTATLVRFTIEINKDQVPVRFFSTMSDGTMIVTRAQDVGALGNREALSGFNGLLQAVVGAGRVISKPK